VAESLKDTINDSGDQLRSDSKIFKFTRQQWVNTPTLGVYSTVELEFHFLI